MDETKRRRLEAAGWKVGTVQEFLGLSDEEMEAVERRRAERKSGSASKRIRWNDSGSA